MKVTVYGPVDDVTGMVMDAAVLKAIMTVSNECINGLCTTLRLACIWNRVENFKLFRLKTYGFDNGLETSVCLFELSHTGRSAWSVSVMCVF